MGEKLTRSEAAARLRAEAADEDMRIAEDRVAHAARYVDPRDAEIARLRAALDREREAIGVLRSYLSCDAVARSLHDAEQKAIRATLSACDARRAAEAKEPQ